VRTDHINAGNRHGTALTDCLLITSRDGETFDRSQEAFFAPGLEKTRNWQYGEGYLSYGLSETVCDENDALTEYSFYDSEGRWGDRSKIVRYTVRLDGFFSWYGDNDAYAITKPFVLNGENMFINFETSVTGGLVVEILDENGEAIKGYKSYNMFGNTTNRPVEFAKSLKDLIGKKIKVKFTMNDCNLYSFTFE
jgi:hypothetical protein